MSKKVLDPNKVLTGNKGYLKINHHEIAELKELEIKIVPEMKEISLISSVTKGKMITNVAGVITFELYKVFSRFKPIVLECSKLLQPFTFSLEATVYTPNKEDEEIICISNCWLEGDITLLALKSENDFLTEKYEAGFQIESANFEDIISDKYNWNYIKK